MTERLPAVFDYPVVVLDCDGVILDSNRLKSDAMAEAVADYGEALTRRFVRYHQENGGISRYEKFQHFLREMADDWSTERYDALLQRLSRIVREKLLAVPFTAGAESFLARAAGNSTLYIVSGGDQAELNWVFQQRGTAGHFEAILGSPTAKQVHCESIRQTLDPSTPVLFVGDSRLDHEAAAGSGFDFLFLSRYSEYGQWREYCAEHRLPHTPDFETLMRALP